MVILIGVQTRIVYGRFKNYREANKKMISKFPVQSAINKHGKKEGFYCLPEPIRVVRSKRLDGLLTLSQ